MPRLVIVSIALLVLVGCGGKQSSTGVVMGKVTYKDQPVNGALLQFIPMAGENTINIPVSQDGTFRSSDVAPGEYKIVVQPGNSGSGVPSLKGMDPAKAAEAKAKLAQMEQSKPTIAFPKKYQSHLTTDLKPTIVKGEQKLDLVLKD